MQTILVTGGTGFIARRIIVQLLEAGESVRATVRSAEGEQKVRAAMADGDVNTANLSFVQLDLTSDVGWAEAMIGIDAVIHPAAPLGGTDLASMLQSSRDGAVRVIGAAIDAGVQRVVMTSAANTASFTSYQTRGVTDETLWTDSSAPGLDAYRISKTMAEKAAWEYVRERNAETILTTILPGAVFGPLLGADHPGTTMAIARLLRGEVSRVPKMGFEIVDIRDVADAHIRAMNCPAAAGQRYLATGELMTYDNVARVLRNEVPELSAKVSTKSLPNFVVKILARKRTEMKFVLSSVNRRNVHTTAKALRDFGWSPRPAVEVVVATAHSLNAHNCL